MFVFTIVMIVLIIVWNRNDEMDPYDYGGLRNSTKSRSPNGVICTHGAAGRLNNIIIHERKALKLAWDLGRTLVASQEVSLYYDVERLSLGLFPELTFRMIVPYDETLCYGSGGFVNEEDVLTIGKQVYRVENDPEAQLSKLIEKLGNKEQAVVSGWDLFYKYPDAPTYFIHSMMGHLYPRPDLMAIVDNFIDNSFRNNPFVAVHLRNLEGGCKSIMCNPTYETTKKRIRKLLPKQFWEFPIFVASDGQKPDVENTYRHIDNVYFFTGSCIGTGCAVIEFEICSRANAFFGTKESTSDTNIDLWRQYRTVSINGINIPSIMDVDDLK